MGKMASMQRPAMRPAGVPPAITAPLDGESKEHNQGIHRKLAAQTIKEERPPGLSTAMGLELNSQLHAIRSPRVCNAHVSGHGSLHLHVS